MKQPEKDEWDEAVEEAKAQTSEQGDEDKDEDEDEDEEGEADGGQKVRPSAARRLSTLRPWTLPCRRIRTGAYFLARPICRFHFFSRLRFFVGIFWIGFFQRGITKLSNRSKQEVVEQQMQTL